MATRQRFEVKDKRLIYIAFIDEIELWLVLQEAEKRQEEERIRMENILSGNPLLNYSGQAAKSDLKVKRRWDDDVVFKNCARSEPDKKKDQFINDSLRSEFHRKFMEKYVK